MTCHLPLVVLFAATVAAAAQPDARDPYTQHDPTLMRAAGVVALQRFLWGGDHSTLHIQSLMGHEPFRFIETAHFKLAVSLSPLQLPDDDDATTGLRAELSDLARCLPTVDPEVQVLDGWLRALLYARRLEALYREFSRRFGVTEASLAKARPGSAHDDDYAGEGPYLGQEGKYLVLLCRDSSSVSAYLKNFLDQPAPRQSARYVVGGSLLLATAEVMADEDLTSEPALHAAVVYHTTHLLLDGYRHYWHDCPVWFEEGVAHWFRNHFVPDAAHFARRPPELPAEPAAKSWRSKVLARVSRDGGGTAEQLFAVRDAAAMTFAQHLAAWSRIDFLLQEHAAAFPLIARGMKAPDPTRTPPRPTADQIAARQERVLQRVFGWTPAAFDAAWAAWAARAAHPRRTGASGARRDSP